MVIASNALEGGTQWSVTRMVARYEPGPCASVGVQVNTAVTGLMLAPFGAPMSRLKVSSCAGKSGSLALAVKISGMLSLAVRSPMGARTGGLFGTTVNVATKLTAEPSWL